ncbi:MULTISPECIES: phage tail length tape measure family protein [Klebsiella pneumoniae complex]|uniref:Phage tail tape measure protein n=1 Tax=Klebsiella pneumoniae TaxID=573 RepID=A0A483GEA3_KLEPN|nr:MULTISPECIES: phage tail length tape measure family protein [Klebsiella]MBN7731851.1 phage tail tape measure protein [Klebsiella pneumoniae]MBZ1599743.1 phage tail tape measure protein [Klebsiella pneumoniae]MCS5841107.1 phage tail length tape measure family protein [Klebsiella pneumoniae subsp. pneumoniae]MDD9214155.1 phage tail length tape measure family protein [Klebsiella quasipneumoniae]MDW1200362.1 phage tail length tape measure family protein [Klebsiella pneumoniae]
MSQPVGDLVVKIDGDSAKFDEEVAHLNKQLSGLGRAANDSTAQVTAAFTRQERAAKRAGISIGQYNNAMRMLPAQLTDVATQLAGGQSPWLILLQQGGQVKDSFGGLIPTFRGLLGAVSPLAVGVAALTAAGAGIGYIFYQGTSTLSDFNKTLTLSGNTAGLTTDRMLALAKSGQQAGLTFDQTTDSLTALINAGVGAGARFDDLSQSVAKFSTASGIPIEKVAEAFGKLTNDPTSGLIAMAQQFHNVTAEQIDYVAQLQRSGDEAAALQAANDAATKGFNIQTQSLIDNMGTIERSADSLKRAFKSMWDAALDLGRPDTAEEMVSKAQSAFKQADDIWNLRKNDRYVNDEARARFWNDRESARLALDMAQQQAGIAKASAAAAEKEAEAESEKQKYAAQAQANYAKLQTALEKYTARQNELNKALKEGHILQADYAINMAAAKKEYEATLKKTPKPKGVKVSAGDRSSDQTDAETLQLMTQLKLLQQHTGLNDTISQQRKNLWSLQSKFAVIEEASKTRALSKDEQSLLASKDKVLAQAEVNAKLGDQIVAQERLNKLQDNSLKYVTQMQEKTAALTDSAGLSDKDAQRNSERAQLRQGWKNQGGSLEDEGYQKELSALEGYYAAQDEMRNNWLAGVQSSWENYADMATNYNQIAADTTNTALGGVTSNLQQGLYDLATQSEDAGDALSNMVEGFGKTVIQTLAQLAAQWLVYQGVQLLVGKTTQATAVAPLIANAQATALQAQLAAYASTAAIPIVGPGLAPAALAAAAGVTTPLVAAISASALAGMAHDGIDKIPETGTWLLKKGERVTTAGTSAKLDATLDEVRQQRTLGGKHLVAEFHNNFSGKPDDTTMQMVNQQMRESEKRLKHYFTSQIINPTEDYGRSLNAVYRGRRIK